MTRTIVRYCKKYHNCTKKFRVTFVARTEGVDTADVSMKDATDTGEA